jgi:hypothetical protein
MKDLCVSCEAELEESTQGNIHTLITFLVCPNKKCTRFGLVTLVYKEQDWKTNG